MYGNTCLLNTLVKYASAPAGAGEYHMQCSVYTHGATFYTVYSLQYTPSPFMVEEIHRNRNFETSLCSQLYNTSSSLICQDFSVKLSYDFVSDKIRIFPPACLHCTPIVIIIIRPPRPGPPPCPPRSASCCCCGDSGGSGRSRHPA